MSFAKTDCANDVNPVSLPTLHLSSSLFLFAVLEWRYPASAGGSSCLGKLLPSLAAGMEMKSCCRALLLQQQRGEVWFLAGLIWSVLQCQCSSWQSITSACLSAWAHKKHIHVGSTGCVQVEQVIPTGCSCQPWSRLGWWNSSFGQKLSPSSYLKEPCSLHFQSRVSRLFLQCAVCPVSPGAGGVVESQLWTETCAFK